MADADKPASTGKKGGALRMVMITVLLLALGGGGAWYYLMQVEAAAAETGEVPDKLAEPMYWPFEPAFVVNLPDGAYMRYLKLELALMTRDSKVPAALEQHKPLLRNELLLMLSDAEYERLLTTEGKQALREEALAAINGKLAALGVEGEGVEDLYFVNFVMQ